MSFKTGILSSLFVAGLVAAVSGLASASTQSVVEVTSNAWGPSRIDRITVGTAQNGDINTVTLNGKTYTVAQMTSSGASYKHPVGALSVTVITIKARNFTPWNGGEIVISTWSNVASPFSRTDTVFEIRRPGHKWVLQQNNHNRRTVKRLHFVAGSAGITAVQPIL